jgi:triphosphoribosyl-dephospho-CoA synthase
LESTNVATFVGNCASIAALLEVSTYPKPGNIHRLNDYPETKYEHFLAGSVSMGREMGKLAGRTFCSKNSMNIGLGDSVLEAVKEMFKWQTGGNIHLGIILLFAPLSAAAGLTSKTEVISVDRLREKTKKIISESSPRDSAKIYSAIDRAMSFENLGSVGKLDIKNQSSIDQILKDKITPINIFELCKERDSICSEWVTGFNIVFTEGYPTLKSGIDKGQKINEATLNTFLKILKEHPDSLIQRKEGLEVANWVTEQANLIIEKGGASTEEGIKMLWGLDHELQIMKGQQNPGTTADLTAASLFVLLLTGWIP